MKVLITGAGFSAQMLIEHLGDDICTIISRNEKRQYELSLMFPKLTMFLGDIRDRKRMASIFVQGKFTHCFHTSAYKRVDTNSINNCEMLSTNVTGSEIIGSLCVAYNVIGMLFSTDKAVDPVNYYGYTKQQAEMNWKQIILRMGNIYGSTGSVITNWERGIYNVNKDCTRFFLHPKEFKEFIDNVLKAIPAGNEGIFIPKMRPCSILDLWIKWVEENKDEKIEPVIVVKKGMEKDHEVLMTEMETFNAVEMKDMFYIHPRLNNPNFKGVISSDKK